MTTETTKGTIQDLPMLENMRQALQKHRIQMGNRIAAVEQERSQADTTVMALFFDRFQTLEDEAAGMIAATIKDHELWPWLDAVKGIGPGLAGQIVAPIDITEARSISALWRYAGQGTNAEGQRDRPVKGEKLNYNAGLKRTCFLVAQSFMRAGSPYRREYDEAKAYYQGNRPDWTAGHVDMAAKRKMVKLFLCFSPDTELWTIDGPKAITEIDHEDLLATMNPATGELEYQRPTELHAYDYDGDLVHFQSESFDLLVTPNHRMWTRQRNSAQWGFVDAGRFLTGKSQAQEYAELSVAQASDYASIYAASAALGVPETSLRRWVRGQRPWGIYPNTMQFDTSIKWQGVDADEIDGVPTDDWLTFLGWFLSDGHSYKPASTPGGYVVGITQKDTAVLEDLSQLMVRMGYSPFIKANAHTPQMRVYNKELFGRMSVFGKAADKFIPFEIKQLPVHRLRVLLAALFAGDGTKDETGDAYRYSSVSRQLAVDVAEIAWKCGYGFKLRTVERDYGQPLHVVNLRTGRNQPRIVQPVLAEPYRGAVHCVTVPNHLLFAGRNGKFAWTGNSHLWMVWRYERRLPIRLPYVIEHMGHSDLKLPWEYVPDFPYTREFQDMFVRMPA